MERIDFRGMKGKDFIVVNGELYPVDLEKTLKKYNLRVGTIYLVAGFIDGKPTEHDLSEFEGCLIEGWGFSGINYKVYGLEKPLYLTHYIEHGMTYKRYGEKQREFNIKFIELKGGKK